MLGKIKNKQHAEVESPIILIAVGIVFYITVILVFNAPHYEVHEASIMTHFSF